ncbi:uncharacterized protein TrAFT101_003682 [Trichoderma asperellum]|uniref:Uncharacterized protein n=1 Tax=Trichoderma asperellum (strain ATCC 204424 / CBS 433.97 / NBRC 101777) TaxID=1042311 RepID=A0A2T3ZQ12_TRIA4|nr:hypothetical protein M441DRAFT_85846 [Trichoderma asperellum CBS 433.97]PTB46879.1 hypothetical protein M441DRAFT_85846 [Trichoderma asperellum CBS 433.97]UKZ87910.1 hypothetical protein TrAFT101_003682 [Trichoderma asperellum]
MADSRDLEPPPQTHVEDPGAHQLAEASDSEDQFTDAQSAPTSPGVSSPVPKTRVELVDNEPSYGEVPGTEAYEKREQDAEPDEIAVVPENASESPPPTPLEPADIPVTMVEESVGEYPGQDTPQELEKHKADATPDIILSPNGELRSGNEDAISDAPLSPPSSAAYSRRESISSQPTVLAEKKEAADPGSGGGDDNDMAVEEGDEKCGEEGGGGEGVEEVVEEGLEKGIEEGGEEGGEDDDFGDDFDDFEEGGHDDDFDDFEDGFQHAEPTTTTTPAPLPVQPQHSLPFSIPDFDGLSPDEVTSAIEPCLHDLFPPEELDFQAFPQLSKDSSIFLTPRSASLWSQLVAPPPLAPPDWIRSRTRRLFLVSLGVPVDLDEILPASKQKKLVLPSLNIPAASPRGSSDLRSATRLNQGDGNASSTSVDSHGKPSASKRRKGPPPPPELDLVVAKHVCQTTDEALKGMTDQELKDHVAKLEAMQGAAKEVLDYWTKRTDEKIGDREAFEGVIENLVAHARKVRK